MFKSQMGYYSQHVVIFFNLTTVIINPKRTQSIVLEARLYRFKWQCDGIGEAAMLVLKSLVGVALKTSIFANNGKFIMNINLVPNSHIF